MSENSFIPLAIDQIEKKLPLAIDQIEKKVLDLSRFEPVNLKSMNLLTYSSRLYQQNHQITCSGHISIVSFCFKWLVVTVKL